MRINSIQHNYNKYCLSITFSDEFEEHVFLQNILNRFEKVLPVNCMITDLDTDCPLYEAYFEKNNYYVIIH